MILSRKHKYVFISTPKTGSHSFFKLLKEEFDGERLGPEFHRTEMPQKTANYVVFSTCRNPYDRLVALWNSLLFAKPDKHGYRDAWLRALNRKDDFLSFCQFAAKHKNDIEFNTKARLPSLMIPQHRWYRRMPQNVIPLHIENIVEEFHALPFVNKQVDIPHALKRKHASWDEIKTEEIIHYANIWAGDDFEKFGYTKEE
jgi:hypothetical protein